MILCGDAGVVSRSGRGKGEGGPAMGKKWLAPAALLLPLAAAVGPARGQGVQARPWAANVVVPQARAYAPRGAGPLQITGVVAGVVVRDQVATTALEIRVRNPGSTRQEAELLVPVPDAAVVRG